MTRGRVEGLESPYPMRGALPGVYHEDPFTMRMIGAFDDGLAPVLATLDNLERYCDPAIAPLDFVEWVGSWVGFPIGETWPEDRARELVARAVELYRLRGTLAGLALLLSIYLGVEPTVTDNGGVAWSSTAGTPLPGTRGAQLTVTLPGDPSDADTRQVESLIASAKPAHVPHTLVIRGGPSSAAKDARPDGRSPDGNGRRARGKDGTGGDGASSRSSPASDGDGAGDGSRRRATRSGRAR